jgi:hypothetical protein
MAHGRRYIVWELGVSALLLSATFVVLYLRGSLVWLSNTTCVRGSALQHGAHPLTGQALKTPRGSADTANIGGKTGTYNGPQRGSATMTLAKLVAVARPIFQCIISNLIAFLIRILTPMFLIT